MFFGKKIQRSFETQKYLGNRCADSDEENREEELKFEAKDLLAIILSGILVFGPLLFLIGGLAFLLTM